MVKLDLASESQENMSQWMAQTVSTDGGLYTEGTVVDMLRPKFISCDYAKKELTLAFTAEPWAQNPEGGFHGGMITACFDISFGLLCHYFAKYQMVTTVSLNVSFLKPIHIGDTLRVQVRAISLGNTLVRLVAEGFIEGKEILAASAESTFMIQRDRELTEFKERVLAKEAAETAKAEK